MISQHPPLPYHYDITKSTEDNYKKSHFFQKRSHTQDQEEPHLQVTHSPVMFYSMLRNSRLGCISSISSTIQLLLNPSTQSQIYANEQIRRTFPNWISKVMGLTIDDG